MIWKLKQVILAEVENWVLWLPVLLGIGIAIYFNLPFEPTSATSAKFLSGAVILFALLRRTLLKYYTFAFIFIALGFAAASFKAHYMSTKFISSNGEKVTISGNIKEIGYSENFPRLTLYNLRIDELGTNLPQKIRLNVRTKMPDDIKVGDRIITDAVLMPPPPPVVPNGYDYAKTAYFNGIGATGYAVRKIVKLKKGDEKNFIASIRHNIGKNIDAELMGDEAAITKALITGDRSKISKETNESFRISGLAHLLSISGLHLVLVTGIFFVSTRFLLSLSYKLSETKPIKKYSAIVALFGAFSYLLISGVQIPAERAFIMAALIMLGIILDRQVTPMRSVAFAAFIVLLFEPDALISPSFQMSFAAASALIAFYDFISARFPNFYRHKILAWVLGAILTSLIAGLATAPFAAFHFGRLSNYGLLANMLAVPTTTFLVMPMAVLSVLVMPLGLEQIPLVLVGYGVDLIIYISAFVAGLKGSYLNIPHMPNYGIALLTIGFLWLVIWRQTWRLLGFLPILIGIASPYLEPRPDIFINQSGKLFALNINDELQFSNRRQSFTSKSWLQYFGQDKVLPIYSNQLGECEFYGKELTLHCPDYKLKVPPNSVVYLPNKIVPTNPKTKRAWTN